MVVRFLRLRYRRRRQQLRRFVYHDLLHADDPPHRLALGIGLGVFVAFTPTVGIQMLIAGFLSWLIGANKAVSVAVVWISNPGTMIPMYWYCYGIGCAILTLKPVDRSWWSELTAPPPGWWAAVSFYWSRFLGIAGPLWLGALIVGLVCGYATYYLALRTIEYYRRRL
ncbi:MAG: DUF2062 domain-containing protein [Planctomycetaceae bacterium]|nr:DUF2062 domain-containing protein [Planctomycetaceae bacterium]